MRDIDDFPFWQDRLLLLIITDDPGDLNGLDLRAHPGSRVTRPRRLAVRDGGLVLKHCAKPLYLLSTLLRSAVHQFSVAV